MRFRRPTIRGAVVVMTVVATLGIAVADTADAAGVGPRITVSVSGTTLRIRDSSQGSINEISFDNYIDVKVKRDEGLAYIAEEGDVIAGAGCVAGEFEEDTSAGNPEDLWNPNWTTYDVVCAIDNVKRVDINAGKGDDIVEVILSHVPVKIVGGAGSDDLQYWSYFDEGGPFIPYFSTSNINGGLGDDYIIGGRGDDVINGARGFDQIEGVCGVDRMYGGSDDDTIYADETIWGIGDCGPIADYVNCGDGDDFYEGDVLDLAVGCE